jgi:hypothetical protein
MNPKLRVGSLVIAKRHSGVCDVGEVGVCYGVYPRGVNDWGYSIIFAHGKYDGFSERDIEIFLEPTDIVIAEVSNYEFSNVGELMRDYRRGRFQPAWDHPWMRV